MGLWSSYATHTNPSLILFFPRKMASVDTSRLIILRAAVQSSFFDPPEYAFHLFLVPYWLNGLLIRVSYGGRRSSNYNRKTTYHLPKVTGKSPPPCLFDESYTARFSVISIVISTIGWRLASGNHMTASVGTSRLSKKKLIGKRLVWVA
jgi:hypothetical protein